MTIAPLSSLSGVTTGSQNAAPAAGAASTTISKDMFLQLLVAQLKNQNPLNPSDGTQFVTQLAQFQQMEQGANSGQDLTGIHQDLDQLVAALAPPKTSQT